jgi:outer membrane protein OmpA-like peptidoglycan-associated protein
MLRLGRETPAALAILFVALSPTTANAQERVIDRFALRFEGAAGAMLSPFQRNDDGSAYDGNTKGFRTLAAQGSARLAVTLVGPVALQVSIANWVFPSTTGGATGWVFAPMGGLHIEPRVSDAARVFVDLDVGTAFTGLRRRLTLDAAIGVEFDVARAVSLGPVLRYGQVVQPEAYSDGTPDPFPQDARFASLGLSIAFRVPRAELRPEPPPPPPPPPILDTDHDGVLDPEDLCPSEPSGAHADPTRRGCPDADSDHDEVFDHDDLCPNTAQGANPDPARRGCPSPDRDGDRVPDMADQCPETPSGVAPDPSRLGCPVVDTDHDGIVDGVDRCPDRAETFNNFEDADGCPDRPSLVTLSDGVIRILGTINFATASDRILGRRSFEILDSLVGLIAAHREIARLEVQGHTDDRGAHDYNQELSQRRAAAVRLYLVEHGIVAARLTSRGYGPDRPMVANDTRIHRAENRRVEMHIVEYADGSAPPATTTTVTPPPTAAH